MKICPKCAAENRDTANFCDECGTALEIKTTETPETVNDPEPVSETSKENINTVENVESTPVAVAETVRDGLESATEQTEKKEESSPKKKKLLIIGVLTAALICIISFMATRPRLKSLEVTYTGDTTEGIVLDNNNEGFKVTAVYSNGKEEDVPAGEWKITEPQTLVADEICDIKIKYKNISQDITIECSTTKISYIKATYNGAAYEGTIINNKSDITVIAVCNSGYSFELNRNQWYLTPKEVTLIKDKPENIKLSADFNDNGETVTISTVISITGIENKIESIEAEYNGSTYEGTVIDQKSDIEVEGKYSDGKVRDIDKKNWSLDPESVTLEDGKTSTIKVIVKQDDGKTVSTELEIEGKEKPFTDPKIEGDHYNCTPKQFVSYLPLHSGFSISPTTENYIDGETGSSYILKLPSSPDVKPTGLILKNNEEGKMNAILLLDTDQSNGAAEAFFLAMMFDPTINEKDTSSFVELFLHKVYKSENTVIVMDSEIASDGYLFYVMPRKYFDNVFKQ